MQDTIIMADISFAKLLENLAPKLRTVREFIFLTDERHAGTRWLACLPVPSDCHGDRRFDCCTSPWFPHFSRAPSSHC